MYTNKKSSADPTDDFHYPTIVRFDAAQQKAFPLGEAMHNKDDANRHCCAYISSRLNWGKYRRRNLLLSTKIRNGKKCPHSADIIISYELNWEECRRHNLFYRINSKRQRGASLTLK